MEEKIVWKFEGFSQRKIQGINESLFQDFCKLESREGIPNLAPQNTALSQESRCCIFSAEIKII